MIRKTVIALAAAALAATASAASAQYHSYSGGYSGGGYNGYGNYNFGYQPNTYSYKTVCEDVIAGYHKKQIYEYGYYRYVEVPYYKKVCKQVYY